MKFSIFKLSLTKTKTMKLFKFLPIAAIAALTITSCDTLVDYSGTYYGTADLELTIGGVSSGTTPTAITAVVTRENGTYYVDGWEMTGSGSNYSATVSEAGITYDLTVKFASASMDYDLSYTQDLAGTEYVYSISGTLDEI